MWTYIYWLKIGYIVSKINIDDEKSVQYGWAVYFKDGIVVSIEYVELITL